MWSRCADCTDLEALVVCVVLNQYTKVTVIHKAKPHLILLITRDTFHFCKYISKKHTPPAYIPWAYLLVFHMWTTSGSVIFLLSAWASKKSKKYLMATGALLLGKLQMLLKSFSTTEWIATWKITKLIFCYCYIRIGYFTSESCLCPETNKQKSQYACGKHQGHRIWANKKVTKMKLQYTTTTSFPYVTCPIALLTGQSWWTLWWITSGKNHWANKDNINSWDTVATVAKSFWNLWLELREVRKSSLASFLGHWSSRCHLWHMLNTCAHQHFTVKRLWHLI